MKPLVSFLIVTYQSDLDIQACLDTISTFVSNPYEVLIIDTGSSDQTIKIIKSHELYRRNLLRLFIAKANLGYAGGQQFLSYKAKGELLFFLNPDARLTKSTVTPLLERAESSDKIFAVQPAVWLTNDTSRLNLTGKLTHYLGFDYLRDYIKTELPESGEITSFSGSGVLCKARIFKQLGGFDKDFFMYYEDSDLSWRARAFGYQIWFEPASSLFHNYKYTPDNNQQTLQQKLYFNERNRNLMLLKNYSIKSIFILFPAWLFLEILLLGYSLINGWFGKKIYSYVAIWSLRNVWMSKRAKIQSNRTILDSQISNNFVSIIDFSHYDHPVVKFVANPILRLYWAIVKVIL